jgi:hypothetical protein
MPQLAASRLAGPASWLSGFRAGETPSSSRRLSGPPVIRSDDAVFTPLDDRGLAVSDDGETLPDP